MTGSAQKLDDSLVFSSKKHIEDGSRWMKIQPSIFDCFKSCKIFMAADPNREVQKKEFIVLREKMPEVILWGKANLGSLLNTAPRDNGQYAEDHINVMCFYSDDNCSPGNLVLIVPLGHVFSNNAVDFDKMLKSWTKTAE